MGSSVDYSDGAGVPVDGGILAVGWADVAVELGVIVGVFVPVGTSVGANGDMIVAEVL